MNSLSRRGRLNYSRLYISFAPEVETSRFFAEISRFNSNRIYEEMGTFRKSGIKDSDSGTISQQLTRRTKHEETG